VAEQHVLICSIDLAFSTLLTQSLRRRNFDVQQAAWAPCHEEAQAGVPDSVNVVIVDVDCPEPRGWKQAMLQLRDLSESVPVVLLAYGWPNAQWLRARSPCGYVRKPFAK
jgi:DNA-binding response OmpR family regulator